MAGSNPSRHSFRTDIEGLRAIAVLGVLAFHAGVPHVGGGYVGVDVFYVISGFLITGLMLRDSSEQPPLGSFLGSFYARRVRRILPAATLVLLTTLLGASLLQNPLENASLAADARWTSFFGANFRFAAQSADYFTASRPPSPFLQYWSLSVEEQFYLIWPVLFWCVVALTKRHKSPGLRKTLVAIGLASFMLSISWMRTAPINAFYLLPARAWELGLGALLATYTDELMMLPPRIRQAGVLVGLSMIIVTMAAFTERTAFPGWTALPPTLGTALVLACGDVGEGLGLAFLSWRPMQLVGRFSFALYLWHWPALVLKIEHVKWVYASWTTRSAFMLLTSVPASVVTYYVVENPLRNFRALRSSWRRSLLFGAALIVMSVVGTFAFERFGSTARLSTDRTVVATAGHLSSVVVPTNFVPANLVPPLVDTRDHRYTYCASPCVVGLPGAHHKIILFGNSHAAHWGTAFQAAAPLLDADVEIHAPGGCPSFLIPVELLGHIDKRACEASRASVFEHLLAEPPDVLVLSNLSVDAFDASPKQWEDGVRAAIRRAPKVTKVVVFSETPQMKQSMPLCLVANLEHAERCDQKWPTEINVELKRIVTEEGATYVNLRPLFCTADRCPAITEDTLIYADGNHLTIAFSSARASWLVDTLRPLLTAR